MIIVFQSQSIGEALDTTHTLTHARTRHHSIGIFIGRLRGHAQPSLLRKLSDSHSGTVSLKLANSLCNGGGHASHRGLHDRPSPRLSAHHLHHIIDAIPPATTAPSTFAFCSSQPLLVHAWLFPSAPVRKACPFVGVHPLNSSRPLHAEIDSATDDAARPRHVARCVCAVVRFTNMPMLSSKCVTVAATLPIHSVLRGMLVLEPALAIRVVPTGIKAPTYRQWAEDPAITWSLGVPGICRVCLAPIAAVLRRRCTVVNAKDHRIAAGVRVRLLTTDARGGDARAVFWARNCILSSIALLIAATRQNRHGGEKRQQR